MKKDFDNLSYGKKLKEIRKNNNLTQNDVAKLIDIDAKYISKIENGNSVGTIETLLKFCKAYKITPNEILSEFIKEENSSSEIIKNKFEKLNIRDKEIISSLIDAMLKK